MTTSHHRTRGRLGESIYVDLVRLHERLSGRLADLFREHGISLTQYNVLRILRGAPTNGATCSDIADRLLNRVPDVTRLIDRMERDGLVTRRRSETDRRVVLVRLTATGRRLVDRLDQPVRNLHTQNFSQLGRSQLESLAAALASALEE